MKASIICSSLTMAILTFSSASAQAAKITEDMVNQAQSAWASGIVNIGKAKVNGKDYKAVAAKHIKDLYDYQNGQVLFKPTKANNHQFRETFDEAHSYFVKGIVSEDGGFAINPWIDVRFDNHQILIEDDVAIAMGNYYFTTVSDQEVKVEYTFGYRLDNKDNLRIVLHHSSLPFAS